VSDVQQSLAPAYARPRVIPFVITMAIRVITIAIRVITMAIRLITMRRSG
jgi:hypothetical protein